MAKQEIKLNSQPSKEEIQAWKEQYGDLLVIKAGRTVNGVVEIHRFAFKKNIQHKMTVIEEAQRKLIEEKSPVQYQTVLIKNTIINGVDVLFNEANTDLFLAVGKHTDKLLGDVSTEIENF